uniref:Impact RWD domain protein n=1 Tax=Podarcis muralis TaxID=64176 RepID=A0A670I9R0_PODMU|nr:protein IMPACT isoform X2 [Podarcis muralis]
MAASDPETAQRQVSALRSGRLMAGRRARLPGEGGRQKKLKPCLLYMAMNGAPLMKMQKYSAFRLATAWKSQSGDSVCSAPWLSGQEYAELANYLEELYVQNLGESILYLWVEKIREFLIEKSQSSDSGPDVKKITEETDLDYEENFSLEYQPLRECAAVTLNFDLSESQEDEELPPIYHGNPITDRRSTFQAHLAPVVSPKQVKNVLAELYKNKKIASATHNIYAYRIYCEDKQTFLQDCEDDGETAAGGRLLHLMQILDVRNVLVVVSRWYGGILLGPDRFKHINNCARNILVEQNYTKSPENLSKQLGKNKRIRKDKKKM